MRSAIFCKINLQQICSQNDKYAFAVKCNSRKI